jgi:hypothetical protein
VKRRVALLILTHMVGTYAFWPLLLGTSQAFADPFTLLELWGNLLLFISSPFSAPRCLGFVTVTANASVGHALCAWITYLLPLFPAYWLLNRILPKAPPLGPGFCWKCGYDLRATPDRCPECGQVPLDRTARPQ